MHSLKVIFHSSLLYFLFCLIFFNGMAQTTIRTTTQPTRTTTQTTNATPTLLEMQILSIIRNNSVYNDVAFLIDQFLRQTNGTITISAYSTLVPSYVYYYLVYFVVVSLVFLLSKVSVRKLLHLTTYGVCGYVCHVIKAILGMFINRPNYHAVKRKVTEIVVPPKTPFNVRKGLVQSGDIDQPNQGAAVAPPTDAVQPQGDIPLEKPLGQEMHGEMHDNSGDIEENNETSEFSQFSVIKTPAVTRTSKITTNCDDLGTMTLSDLLSKNFFIETFNISTTDNAFNIYTPFKSWAVPFIATSSKQFKAIFKAYQFCRFDLQFKFVLSGSVQQTGLFCITSVPNQLPRVTNVDNPSAFKRGLAHPLANDYVLLRPNKESMAVIDVPWTSNRSFMEDNRANGTNQFEPNARMYDWYSTVYFNIILPLTTSTTGASTCTVSVYASIKNLRADVMAIPQMFDNNVTIDSLRDSSLPINMVGQKLDFKAEFPFGMDKPTDTRNYDPKYIRAYQNLSNCRSTVVAHRMSLNGKDVNLVDTSCFKVEENAMSIDAFKNVWFCQYVEQGTQTRSQSKVFQWTSTMSAGTLFAAFPVSLTGIKSLGSDRITATSVRNDLPAWATNDTILSAATATFGYNDANDFANWVNTDKDRHSVLSYLARQFSYWRGTLKYRLYIASNMWYNGKVFVHISYGTGLLPQTITATGDDPRMSYGFEINANSECAYYDFEVPYRSFCQMGDTNETIAYVGFYVDQALKANNGMPSSVNMTVFRALGDDFIMSDYSSYGYLVQAGEEKEAKPKVQKKIDKYTGKGANLEMCGSYKAIKPMPPPKCMGVDKFTSIKQLLTIPWHIGNYYLVNFNQPCYPISLSKVIETGFFRTFGSWYSGYKGSLRLVFRFFRLPGDIRIDWYATQGLNLNFPVTSLSGNSGTWVRSAVDYGAGGTVIPPNPYNFDLDTGASLDTQSVDGTTWTDINTKFKSFLGSQTKPLRSVWVNAQQDEVIIEIPYRHNKLFSRTYHESGVYGQINIFNPGFWPSRSNWNLGFELSIMAGDDFQFVLPTFATCGQGIEGGYVLPVDFIGSVAPNNYPPNVKIVDEIYGPGISGANNSTMPRCINYTEWGISNMPPVATSGEKTNN